MANYSLETTDADILRSIAAIYGTNSDIWQKIQAGSATSAEIYQAYSVMPQMQVVTAKDGSTVLGWDYDYSNYPVIYDDSAAGVNSNFDFNTYSGNTFNALVPANAGGGGGTPYTFQSGGKFTGTGNTASLLNSPVSPTLAVAGASLACKLGAAISEGLYDLNPDWWAEHLPTMNPETWPSIAGSNSVGQDLIRTLFGINSSGEMSAYMSTEALAYVYMGLRDMGALSGGGDSTATIDDTTGLHQLTIDSMPFICAHDGSYTGSYNSGPSNGVYGSPVLNPSHNDYMMFTTVSGSNASLFICSKTPLTFTRSHWNRWGYYTQNFTLTRSTVNNTYVYTAQITTGNLNTYTSISPGLNVYLDNASTPSVPEIAYVILYGTVSTPAPIDGITPNGSGTTPDPNTITGTTIADVIAQLKQNYPDLFTDSVTNTVMQNDGTLKDYEYVPVPWMNDTTQTSTQPTTGTRTQTDTSVSPQTVPQLFPTTTGESTVPPDTGSGDGSADASPTGSASSLWAIYNPSQSQLDSFGSWLWSSNFVEQLKKLFNDPMQAIIGVHKVYATPPTSGSENIKCGYLDSGVSAAKVSNQYTSIDCGTVNLNEYFGNVFDYDPFTKISVYLPFIGVVPLKTSEVMRSKVNITYGVDVITGACLAKINITRDGCGGILYSYGGSRACHYPISSGSYSGIISGIVTAATGIAASVATGNPLAAVGGVVSGAKSMRATVQHSGGFTGCAGVMGPKIPYIIIERPQIKLATGYEGYEGMPANSVVTIGSCSGYVKFKEVHAEISGAYDDELSEIEGLLKSGIII